MLPVLGRKAKDESPVLMPVPENASGNRRLSAGSRKRAGTDSYDTGLRCRSTTSFVPVPGPLFVPDGWPLS